MKIVVAHAADETVDPPQGSAARAQDGRARNRARACVGAGHEVSGIAVDGTARLPARALRS